MRLLATRKCILGVVTLVTVLICLLTTSAAMAASGGSLEQQPTQAEVDAQQAKVEALAKAATDRADAVRGQQAALQDAAAQAGLALGTYTSAVRRLNALQFREQQQQDLLARAQQAVAQNRDALGRWAREAYQGGGPLSTHVTLNALLQADSSQDVSTTLVVLRRIGTGRNRAVDAVETAQHQQAAATEAAADASEQASDAAVQAASDRAAADRALSVQRVALGQAESSLNSTRGQLGKAQQKRSALRAAVQAAKAAKAAAVAAAGYVGSSQAGDGNQVTGAVGSCTGGDDISRYPNGQIPLAALCQLQSSPGHYLRADAAYAFDRMSNAYAVRFGGPICVTDSYRSLAEQISVYARKPGLAAVPGTSNHGWGTATDLCGGIQDFGSAQHHWMQVNAPLFNWFHPAWAQADGSRPEPWHWEFAG